MACPHGNDSAVWCDQCTGEPVRKRRRGSVVIRRCDPPSVYEAARALYSPIPEVEGYNVVRAAIIDKCPQCKERTLDEEPLIRLHTTINGKLQYASMCRDCFRSFTNRKVKAAW